MSRWIVAEKSIILQEGKEYLMFDDTSCTLQEGIYKYGMEFVNVAVTSYGRVVSSKLGFCLDKLKWSTLDTATVEFDRYNAVCSIDNNGYRTAIKLELTQHGGFILCSEGCTITTDNIRLDNTNHVNNSGKCFLNHNEAGSLRRYLVVKPFGQVKLCGVYAVLCTYGRDMKQDGAFLLFLHKGGIIGCLSSANSVVSDDFAELVDADSDLAKLLLVTGVDFRGHHD